MGMYYYADRGSINCVKEYLNEIIKYPLFNEEQELEAFNAFVQETDPIKKRQLKNYIMERNLRLVVSVAKTYSNNKMEFEDVISEGNIGLMKAIDKFDPNKGYKFSTYAIWWIKQSIVRALSNKARTIRVPVYMTSQMLNVRRFISDYKKCNFDDPEPEVIASALNIPVEKVIELQLLDADPISLSAPADFSGDDGRTSYQEYIADSSVKSIEEEYEVVERKTKILELLDILSEREKEMIILRFGLRDDQKPMTLEQVGKIYNVTRERIRQIEANALRRLKIYAKKQSLEEYF